MTRPWSPAEIAGAKALADSYREDADNPEAVPEDVWRGYFTDARLVLDAAAAAQQAKLAEMGYPSAQVRGAGAGEQQ